MSSFNLAEQKHISSGEFGGGGGGVVVNGIKPGNDTFYGEGFGGGANGTSYSSRKGYPGCVLIET